MFHQEKLFYTLPAVKEDIKPAMRISAEETADSLGLKKGQWISFLCSPSCSKRRSEEGAVSPSGQPGRFSGVNFISTAWDSQKAI